VRKISLVLASVLALLFVGVSPAGATTLDGTGSTPATGREKPSFKLDIEADVTCGLVVLTFKNGTPWDLNGEYKVDGGEPTVVPVADHEKVVVEIPFEEDGGKHIVEYRWAKPEVASLATGGDHENLWEEWKKHFEWKSVKVYTDCTPAEPTITQPTCEDPTGFVTIPEQDAHTYWLEGQPLAAGDHELEPGVIHVIKAFRGKKFIDDFLVVINEAPTEEECNPEPEPTPDPEPEPEPEPTPEPEPEPEPTTPPEGDEDGADNGTGDELPDTGAGTTGGLIGGIALIIAGFAASVLRRRVFN
jgi:LPXTG-motif cell wall-anchored protein